MLDYVGLLKGLRSPDRVRSSQIIAAVVDEFEPLGSPDAALIAGTGSIDKTNVLVFAQEKPRGRDADYPIVQMSMAEPAAEGGDRFQERAQAALPGGKDSPITFPQDQSKISHTPLKKLRCMLFYDHGGVIE